LTVWTVRPAILKYSEASKSWNNSPPSPYCIDCPHDEDKTEPGVCGCNQIEQWPCDQCPDDPKKVSPGT
jgi:hypothetical protein